MEVNIIGINSSILGGSQDMPVPEQAQYFSIRHCKYMSTISLRTDI